jgi:hypothetical protein
MEINALLASLEIDPYLKIEKSFIPICPTLYICDLLSPLLIFQAGFRVLIKALKVEGKGRFC